MKQQKKTLYTDKEVKAMLMHAMSDNSIVHTPEVNVMEKKGESTSEQQNTSLNTVTEETIFNQMPLDSPIPKWYRLKQRRQLRQELILKHLSDFSTQKKIEYLDKNNKKQYIMYLEDDNSIREYKKELESLKIKELVAIGHIKLFNEYKFSMLEVFYKMNKKKRCLVRLIHKNNTINDYVVSQNTRFFTINEANYIRVIERGIFDTKYGMTCYVYYEGNPFPLAFKDDYHPLDNNGNTIPDAQLLKKTMKFEYAEQLASSNLDKNVNLAMIFSILAFIVGTLNVILMLLIMNKLEII